jgi:hypothetical protein
MGVDAAGNPADIPLPPPPKHHDPAHEMVVDTVFPQLSTDQPMIIQFPTYRDEPRPNKRGTQTAQEG